jgi:3,4-dihydroxy 2-butanone 4-phosphate synthase/GTP cyclohydrolase II
MTTQEVATLRVLKAIEAVRNGGMVIMVDDEDRENEGDLVFAAAHACPEKINFMTKEARGLICLSLDQAAVDRLKLPMMEDSSRRNGGKSTAFTVSIEARHGVTTGISAADRAQTIRVATDPTTGPDDIVVPGHVFPLKARPGGVLERAGHTEGSVDLARLAGFAPAAVICEIMNDDGSMARMPDLTKFAERHGLPIVTIADLIAYRLMRESLIEVEREGLVRTALGDFRGVIYRSLIEGTRHLALVKGAGFEHEVVDVRVHRQRPLVDVFGDPGRTWRHRVDYGLRMLRDVRAGVLVYLIYDDPHNAEKSVLLDDFAELTADAHAKERREKARPWLETDPRLLGLGAQVLRHLGVRRMRVHMSRPTPLKGLAGFDLEVVESVAIDPAPHA